MITGELEPSRPASSQTGPIPEPLASTLITAKREDKRVFIDFYAAWCGPCIIMEETTLSDAKVGQALEAFVFLKVDTDDFPEVATYYSIVGMPTLIVVDTDGKEVWRQVGSITAEDLVVELTNL